MLNRANARMRIFDKPVDHEAFEQILVEAVLRVKMRLLAYCVMPNHWHLVLWPREDGDLSTFVGWLTLTHTQRWHAHRRAERLGESRQPSGKPARIGGIAALCEPRAPVRKRRLGTADDNAVWSRFGVPPPRAAIQGAMK